VETAEGSSATNPMTQAGRAPHGVAVILFVGPMS
jgi:hypothetical protein